MQPLLYRRARRSQRAFPWVSPSDPCATPRVTGWAIKWAHMPEPEPDNVPLPPTPHDPPRPDSPPEIIEPPDPGHEIPVREPGLWSAAFSTPFLSSSPIGCPQP